MSPHVTIFSYFYVRRKIREIKNNIYIKGVENRGSKATWGDMLFPLKFISTWFLYISENVASPTMSPPPSLI